MIKYRRYEMSFFFWPILNIFFINFFVLSQSLNKTGELENKIMNPQYSEEILNVNSSFSYQNPRSSPQVTRVFAQAGKIFMYQFEFVQCVKKRNSSSLEDWVHFHKELTMLIGLPHSELLGSFDLSYNCLVSKKSNDATKTIKKSNDVMETINVEIILKSSSMNPNIIIEVFTPEDKSSLTLLKKIEIVQIIETNVKNYKVVISFANYFWAILNWGKKSNAKLTVAINIDPCNLDRLRRVLTSYDSTHIIGIVMYAPINESFSSVKNSCKNFKNLLQLAQTVISTSPTIRRRVAKREVPFLDIPDIFKTNLPKHDCSNNTPPVAKEKTVTYTFHSNTFSHIEINEALFTDKEDGNLRMLKLRLTWQSGVQIKPDDWIQFSSVLKLIYSFSTFDVFEKQPVGGYKLLATATDQCNSSVETNVYIQIESPFLSRNKTMLTHCGYVVLIVESTADRNKPYINILAELIDKVTTFNNIISSNLIVLKVFRSSYRSKSVYSVLFTLKTCNNCIKENSYLSKNFSQSSNFKRFLAPNFNYNAVLLSKCGKNSSPKTIYQIDSFILSINRTTVHEISNATFFDIEDGFLDNLTLQIDNAPINGVLIILHKHSFVFYQYKEKITEGLINITVTDSSQKLSFLPIKFIPSEKLSLVNRWFTFTMDVYYDEFYSNDYIIIKLLKIFSKFLGGEDLIHDCILLGFDRKGVFPLSIEMTLSFSSINYKHTIEVEKIKKEIMQTDGRATISFATFFLPHVRNIHCVYYDLELSSSKNDIKVINGIPPLIINASHAVHYSIPVDTFRDNIDGNTKNLILKMTSLNGQVLQKNSWIQFDSDRQEISIALTLDTMQEERTKSFKFMLIAINSRKQTANLTIHLIATRNNSPTGGCLVKLIVKDYLSNLLNDMQFLIPFLIQYDVIMKTSLRKELKSFSRVNGLSTIIFVYNCTKNDGLCDHEEMDSLKKKNVVLSFNKNKTNSELTSDIDIMELKINAFGICDKNSSSLKFLDKINNNNSRFLPLYTGKKMTEINNSTLSPAIDNNTLFRGPQVRLPLPRIFVSFCKSFVYYLNPDTFFDEKDGNAKTLDIELMHKIEGKVSNSSWIQWDKKLQRMFGFLKYSDYDYMSTQRGNHYILKATDTNGYSIEADINFIIPIKRIRYFYRISNIFQTKTGNEIEANHQIALWHKLTSFTGQTKIQIISFRKLSGQILLEWFICETDEITCPNKKIESLNIKLLNGKEPSSHFYKFMLPEYEVLGTEFIVEKTCAEEEEKMAARSYFKPTHMQVKITNSSIISRVPYQTPNTKRMHTLNSNVTMNLPPILLKSIPILYVFPCKITEYNLNEDVFFDPEDGLTRSLKITITNELFLYNSTTQTISIKFIPESLSFFQIVATDKYGLSVAQNITVMKTEDEVFGYNISFSGTIVGKLFNDYDLNSMIKQRLQSLWQTLFNGSILVHSIHKHNYNLLTIVWLPCSLKCSKTIYQNIHAFIFQKDSLQNNIVDLFTPELIITQASLTVLQPCIDILNNDHTQIPLSISSFITIEDNKYQRVEQLKANSQPVIISRLPILIAYKCRLFSFSIPERFCYDHEDGYTPNLHLQLLSLKQENLGLKHWLHLNEQFQFLYGTLKSRDIVKFRNKILSYYLSCSDKQGKVVFQQIDIIISDLNVPPSHLITFYSYLHLRHNDSEVQAQMLSKIAFFLGDEDTENIEVKNFSRDSLISDHITLTWYNCTIDDPCKPEINLLKNKLFDNINLNSQFTLAMVPEFVMIGGVFNFSLLCASSQTAAPSSENLLIKTPAITYINYAPVAKEPIQDIIVPYCSTFSFRIPEDTFFDIEDGNTRNLKLNLLTEELLPISKTSWVQFVESTQVVYGFSKLIDFKELKSTMEYFLEATDSGEYKAYIKFVLVIPARPSLPFVVNMTLSRFFDFDSSDLIEQIFLAGQVSYFVGDNDVSQVIVVDYVRGPNSVFISWGNCTSVNENCPYKTESLIQTKFFENGNPSTTFVNKMKTYYFVQNITMNSNFHCNQPTESTKSSNVSNVFVKNQPPKVIRFIPPLYVDQCKPFIYNIPEDILIDEDGSTSSLKLKLLDINFKEVQNDSWIILGVNSTLRGIVRFSDIKNNDFRYMLSASDSSGLVTNIPLSLKIKNYYNKWSYHLELEITVQLLQTVIDSLINLIHIINNYFGTTNNPDILPISFKSNSSFKNNYMFAWTFCSLKFETCPREKVNEINTKLFDSVGNVLQTFHNILKPSFSVLSLKVVYSNICLDNNASSYPSSEQAFFLPNITQPLSIFINQCILTTYNVSKYLLELSSKNLPNQITLRYENGSIVPPKSWIQLNQHNSIIYGDTRANLEEIPRRYILQAEYTDKKRLFPLKVDVSPINAKEFHFYISITFKVNLTNTPNDVLLLDLLKTKLLLYFKIDSISIVYLFQNASRFYVKFSFCTNDSNTCNYTHVEYILSMLFRKQDYSSYISLKKNILDHFVFALMPEFTDISAIDELSGPCSFKVNPFKSQTSLNICIKPCGIFHYKVLQNVFFEPLPNYYTDYIIEAARHRSDIPWLHYNKSAMEFYGIPTEHVRMNQPEKGYSFFLSAFELNGGVANKWIYFKICENAPKKEKKTAISLACPTQHKNNYSAFKSILEQLSYIYFQKDVSSLLLFNHSFEQNIMKLIFSGCETTEVSVKEINGTIINSCFVISVSNSRAQDNPPINNTKELRYRPKFCQTNIFDLPIDTFFDDEDGSIDNLYLFVTFENFTIVPNNYWIYLVNTKVHILLLLDTIKSNIYQYYLNAQDSKKQLARIPLIIEISDNFPKFSDFYYLRFKPKSSEFSVVPLIHTLLSTFALFSNASYGVNKYSSLENQSVSLTFFKCSLTTVDCGCSVDCVSKIYLMQEFYIEQLEMNQSHCDFNNAPVLISKISNITVPSKGFLIYQIPNNMFYDVEDGWTRNLSLSMLSPDNCSLQFIAKDQTIYAFASDKTIETYSQKNLSLTLSATDSSGKSATTKIDLIFEPIISFSFSVSILFQISFVKKATFLDLCFQDTFFLFNKLSVYMNTTLSLKSAYKAANSMFIEITFTSSTIRFAPCDYIGIDRFLKLIEDKEGLIADELSKFMLPDYIPRFVSVHKSPTCQDSFNTSPKLNGTLNVDVLSTFLSMVKRLPPDLAYDVEDGNIYNLNTTLLYINGTQVNSDWIYFEDKSKDLFVLGSHQTAERQPKHGYDFMLSIQDSRKAMVSLKFKIIFKLPLETGVFSITETFNLNPPEYDFTIRSDIPSILTWKKNREKLLKLNLDFISYERIETKKEESNNLEVDNRSTYNVTWGIYNDSMSCKFETLKHIENIYKISFNTSDYKINKFQKCLDDPIFSLKTNKTIVVYLDPCQEVIYKLDKNMFWSEENENTGTYYVEATLIYPKSSDIVYDSLSKTFHGPLILDKFNKFGRIEFYLDATHANQFSNAILEFYIKSPYTKYFEIESKVLYFSNESESAKFLTLFRKNVLTFLNSENQGLAFYNYNATYAEQMTAFILNFSICVIKPNCHNYKRVISRLISDNGVINEDFMNAMNDKILPIHMTSRSIGECSIVKEDKIDATVGLCLPLNYKLEKPILETKNLLSNFDWSLKSPLNTWIKFDSFTQRLAGMPLKKDIPTSESKHNVELILMYNNGIIQSKNITLKYSTIVVKYVVNIQMISKRLFSEKYELRNKLQEKFDAIKHNSRINVYDISTSSVARFQLFWVSVFSCSNYADQCNPVKQHELYSTFVNTKYEIHDHVVKEFSDTFNVLSITEKNNCSKLLLKKPLIFKFKTCQRLNATIPTFSDFGPDARDYFELLSENGSSLPIYSLVQFNKVNSVIYGFAIHDLAFKSPKELRYVLRLHNWKYNYFDLNLIVMLPTEKPRYNLVARTEILSYLNTEITDVDILSKFVIRVSSFISVYFGKVSGDTISIKSYARRGDKIPQRLIIEWLNCSNIESCNEDKNLFNKIFINDLSINPTFAREINQEHGFVHRKTSFYSLNSCEKEPDLPTFNSNSTPGNVTILLNSRSFFERNLKKHIFIDITTSYNLSAIMTFVNKSFIPFNHWVQFNKEEMKLFGFPDNTISSRVSYWYILILSDSKGLEIKKYVEIKFLDQLQVGLQLSVDVSCTDYRPPIILHVRDVASEIAKKLKLRLKDIILDFFYLTRKQHIFFVLNLPSTALIENLSELRHSTTLTCKILKTYSVAHFSDKNSESAINGELTVLNGIPDLDITCGKPLVYKIPVDAFYFTGMRAEGRVFELIDKSFSDLHGSSFIKFSDDTFYIFYSLKECFNIKSSRVLNIKVSDLRGNFAIGSFKLKKFDEFLQCCNTYIELVFQLPYLPEDDLFRTYQMLQKDVYDDYADNLRIVNVLSSLSSEGVSVLLANRSLFTNSSCNPNKSYSSFMFPLFESISPVVLHSKLHNLFPDLVHSSVIFCNIFDQSFVELSSDALKASDPVKKSQAISSEEWFLYLLPLFILAFMVVATCVCFYACQCVNRHCFKKSTNLLVDAGSEITEKRPGGENSGSLFTEIPLKLLPPSSEASNSSQFQKLPQNKKLSVCKKPGETKSFNKTNETKAKHIKQLNPKKSNFKKAKIENKKSNLSVSISRRNNSKVISEDSYIDKEILRLPAIPNGPPPPYSPPRRQRVFSQNIIPTYYERYAHKKTTEETAMQNTLKSSSSSSAPSKNSKKYLLIKKSNKQKFSKQNSHISNTSVSSLALSKAELSDSSYEQVPNIKYCKRNFEIPEVLQRTELRKKIKKPIEMNTKNLNRTQIMRYIDDVNAAKVTNLKQSKGIKSLYSRYPLRHKFAKPFLYDYLPVRRKQGEEKYQFHDPSNLYTGLSSSSSSNRDSNRTKTRSRYLDTLVNFDGKENMSKKLNKNVFLPTKSNKKVFEKDLSPKSGVFSNRKLSLNELLEDSHL